MASASGLGGMDRIRIGLFVSTVVFLILSIVFIILFATKHDTSAGYMATGYTSKTSNDVKNDFNNILKKDYSVGTISANVVNGFATVVFSLRGKSNANDVQKKLSGSSVVTGVQVTNGDNSICQATITTAPPATQLTTKPTVKSSVAPVVTTAPPTPSLYCQKPVSRDILIVVDMNDRAKFSRDDKIAALKDIQKQIDNGVDFSATNIFLAAYNGSDVVAVSKKFASTQADFDNDFANTLNAKSISTDYMSLATVFNFVVNTFPNRAATPPAVVLVTDKTNNEGVTTNPRDNGIYIAVVGVGASYLKSYSSFVDQVISYTDWPSLAKGQPFSNVVCNFYNKPATAFSNALALSNDDANTDTPKCETVDIIIAFDKSESLSRIILPKYQDFAKKFVAQYKYDGANAGRIGIISFAEHASEDLSLTDGVNLDIINTAIDGVKYTGGLTNVTSAMELALNKFQAEKTTDLSRGRILIVLSDGQQTIDTTETLQKAGNELRGISAQTFFVGYNGYSDAVRTELEKVTDKEDIFGDLTDATLNGITQRILVISPCPVPKCVTAYFAVEVSEATNDDVVKHLKAVIQLANKNADSQPNAQYQLFTYNEGNNNINPTGDATIKKFTDYIQGLIDNPTALDKLRGGNTRLDQAIIQVTAELGKQSLKNRLFTSNIVFFGQANNAVLDPDVTEDVKKQQLADAATGLRGRTGLIYVVDDSRDSGFFGDDLWTSVTPKDNIVLSGDTIYDDLLKKTDYLTAFSKLTCSLPAYYTCWNTPLDIALIFDLNKKDDAFVNYVTQFAKQFSTQDDTHIALFAYGVNPTSTLLDLSAHNANDLSNAVVKLEEWRNGTLFSTTVTTPKPTTSTAAKTTVKEFADMWQEDYQVGAATIDGLFKSLGGEFGCGHYNDDGDRLFAPNVYLIASDNLGSYNADVWAQYKTNIRERYGCNDCAGTPTLIFLSRTADKAQIDVGVTINVPDGATDIDPTDDTSLKSSIDTFNSLVDTVCRTDLKSCASYECTAY